MAVSRLRRAVVDPLDLTPSNAAPARSPDPLASELEAELMTDLEALAAVLGRSRPPARPDARSAERQGEGSGQQGLQRGAAQSERGRAPVQHKFSEWPDPEPVERRLPPSVEAALQSRRTPSPASRGRTDYAAPGPQRAAAADPRVRAHPGEGLDAARTDADGEIADDAAAWANRRWAARMATAPTRLRPQPRAAARVEPTLQRGEEVSGEEGRREVGRREDGRRIEPRAPQARAPEARNSPPPAVVPSPQLVPSAAEPDLPDWWIEERSLAAAAPIRRRGLPPRTVAAAAIILALLSAAGVVAFQAGSRSGAFGFLTAKTPAVATTARPAERDPTSRAATGAVDGRAPGTTQAQSAAAVAVAANVTQVAETPIRVIPTTRVRDIQEAELPVAVAMPVPEPTNASAKNPTVLAPAEPALRLLRPEDVARAKPTAPAKIATADTPPAQRPAPVGAPATPAAQPEPPRATGLLSFVTDRFAGPKANPNTRVTTDDVNVRAAPENKAAVVTVVKAGTTVTVSECRQWCKVTVNDHEGWIFSGLLTTP